MFLLIITRIIFLFCGESPRTGNIAPHYCKTWRCLRCSPERRSPDSRPKDLEMLFLELHKGSLYSASTASRRVANCQDLTQKESNQESQKAKVGKRMNFLVKKKKTTILLLESHGWIYDSLYLTHSTLITHNVSATKKINLPQED